MANCEVTKIILQPFHQTQTSSLFVTYAKKTLQIMFSNNFVWVCARWNICGWQLQYSKDYSMFTQVNFLLHASQM